MYKWRSKSDAQKNCVRYVMYCGRLCHQRRLSEYYEHLKEHFSPTSRKKWYCVGAGGGSGSGGTCHMHKNMARFAAHQTGNAATHRAPSSAEGLISEPGTPVRQGTREGYPGAGLALEATAGILVDPD